MTLNKTHFYKFVVKYLSPAPTIVSSLKFLKGVFFWRSGWEKQLNQKAYKEPFLKGWRVLPNNRKANVEKWDLRGREHLIGSIRLAIKAAPMGEREDKDQQRGVSLRSNCVNLSYVQMDAPRLTCAPSVSCTGLFKKPAFTPHPWCIISPLGHVPSADSLFFSRHPSVKVFPNVQHVGSGNKLVFS